MYRSLSKRSSTGRGMPAKLRWFCQITLILVLSTYLQVFANVFAQKLSIHKENASLIEVIKDIQAQTGISFLYSSDVLKIAEPVSINFENASITDVLDACFKDQPLHYEIKDNTIVVRRKSEEVSRVIYQDIEGVVRDKDDQSPIIGATILIKGTEKGVITDLDGRFKIRSNNLPVTIVVSYIGYLSQEIVVSNDKPLDIVLSQSASDLAEFVVVGYGETKKENLSGAVDMVGAEKIENRQIPNLGEGLQGLIPNLNITRNSGRAGDGPSFNIRGLTSLNGGSPLILVDNVPVTSSELTNINPSDIESVSVLKDASSAAIYGARAAFGVVLITTKEASSSEIKVNGSLVYGMRTLGDIPDIVTDPYQAMKYKHEAAWPLYNLYPEESRAYALERSQDPSLPSVILNPSNPDYYQYIGQTNWMKEVYKNKSSSYSANFSVSKKDKELSYYFSGGYYRQDGMLKYGNDSYERFNLRAKTDMKLTDWLTLGNNTAYANTTYDRPYYNEWLFFHNVNRTNSLDVPRNPDGSWTSAGAEILGRLQEGGRNIADNNDIMTKFDIKANLVKEVLQLKGDATFRRISSYGKAYDMAVPYKTGPDQPVQFRGANPDFAQSNASAVKHTIYNIYIDFDKTFNTVHAFNALAGFNQESRIYENFWASRSGLVTTNLPSIGLATGDWNGDEGYSDWAVRGVFYRMNYIFDDRYIVEFNGRYDGSSRFPKEDRFGFFPSASMAWVLSEEEFLQPLKSSIQLDFLKIRASYGTLGNQSVADYGYIPSMSSGQIGQVIGGQRPQTVSPAGLVAGSLTWESVQSKNLGIDLRFWDGKLGVTADVFSRLTKDMLVKGKTLPAVLGASEPKINAGDLETRGFEVRLDWRDEIAMAGTPLNYSVGFNLGDYQSEILKYDNPTGLLNDYYEGQTIGEIWGLTNDGFFQSEAELDQLDQTAVGSDDQGYVFYVGDLRFSDLNGDGVIDRGDWTLEDHGDFKKIGNTTPRYSYGADLAANWKGFDLRMFFQGVGKKDWYPEASNHYFWGVYAQPWTNVQAHNLDHWTPETPDGYFPRVKSYIAEDRSELGIPQTRYLQNAAYVRLKNLTIGYTFPKAVLERLKIQNLRLYFSGENLFEISHLKAKLDPEVIGAGGSSNTTTYPFQRTYSLGVNFTL